MFHPSRTWLVSAIGVALFAPTAPQDRARQFLQTVREQMVAGSAFRGSNGVPAVVYQTETGITMRSVRGKLSDSYQVVPSRKRGFFITGASFSAPIPGRKVDPALGFDRERIPAILQELARASGLETDMIVLDVAQTDDKLEVTADQSFHGILVIPGSAVRVLLDYETAQVLSWSALALEMPDGPPPTPADSAIVRDRILYELLVNQQIPGVHDVRLRPAITAIQVQDNRNPDFVTFASAAERSAGLRLNCRYVWVLTARAEPAGWVDGYADYQTGRLLETWRLRSGGGGSTQAAPAAVIPRRGKYRIVEGSKSTTVEGRLVPVTTPLKTDGKAFGLVSGGVAVRAVCDAGRDVLRTSQGTFRPVGALRAALRAMRR